MHRDNKVAEDHGSKAWMGTVESRQLQSSLILEHSQVGKRKTVVWAGMV